MGQYGVKTVGNVTSNMLGLLGVLRVPLEDNSRTDRTVKYYTAAAGQ